MEKMKESNRSSGRNGLVIMGGLVGMIRPLIGFMLLAVLMGSVGNLTATFITILGGVGIATIMGVMDTIPLYFIFGLMVCFAIMRGILRYLEQLCNHYIAFKLLARIRHQVFSVLRKLAPAKLDSKEKGNLISIITSDIELLEVFYAHTISPILIAFLTSVFMIFFIGSFHWGLGILAAFFYLFVGIVIPVINSRIGQPIGRKYREEYGFLNTVVLDNLYGMNEIRQFHAQRERQNIMEELSNGLEKVNSSLKQKETYQRISTDITILGAGILMALLAGYYYLMGDLTIQGVLITTIAMLSSFGPVAALSALSNNLNQTLASGNRVLDLMEEKPVTEEIIHGTNIRSGEIILEHVGFAYPEGIKGDSEVLEGFEKGILRKESGNKAEILKDFSLRIRENTIYGIHGKSGNGKSTLLKLMMRFYETQEGRILYQGDHINQITTRSLRNHISYVTQEVFLFQDTIENNIKIAKANADREEVMEAAKKASIHEFILSLPEGYETRVSELGTSLSGGERQRIGLARAFLHGSPVILLDEPTSNVDSLNEGIILNSLRKEKGNKTIILVSHRESTLAIADEVVHL